MDGTSKPNSGTSIDLASPSNDTHSNDSHSDVSVLDSLRGHSSSGRIKQVWAIGGGKGGVGKSLISSSIAISLSRLGNKVIAVDLDLGGANLHTTLGVELPRLSLSDFFTHRVQTIQECA